MSIWDSKERNDRIYREQQQAWLQGRIRTEKRAPRLHFNLNGEIKPEPAPDRATRFVVEEPSPRQEKYKRTAYYIAAKQMRDNHHLHAVEVATHYADDAVWEVLAWEDVPESGTRWYIGPDDSLRRIAEDIKARADGDVLYNDQGELVLNTVTSFDTGNDYDPDDTSPIHYLMVWPKGTLSR